MCVFRILLHVELEVLNYSWCFSSKLTDLGSLVYELDGKKLLLIDTEIEKSLEADSAYQY